MANRLSRLANAVYIPAVEPVPGREAYCTRVSIPSGLEGASAGSSGGGSSTGGNNTTLSVTPVSALTAVPGGVYTGSPVGGGVFSVLSGGTQALVTTRLPPYAAPPSTLRPRVTGGQVCYPEIKAVPGSPARVDYHYNAGWDAGARSVEPVPEFGQFSGTMSLRLVATQIGLARRNYDHTYQAMTHSVVARPGEWAVVERGITRATGVLANGARITIRRTGEVVSYHVGSDLLYVSDLPLSGEAYGAALLYGLSDEVNDPVITRLSEKLKLELELPQWEALIADGPLSFVEADFPQWEMHAQLSPIPGAVRIIGNIPKPQMLVADKALALISGEVPGWKLNARAGRKERIPNQFVGVVPPPMLRTVALVGAKVTVNATLPPVAGLISDRHVAYVNARKPLNPYIVAWQPYMPPGMIDGMTMLIAHDFTYVESALLLVAMDSLDVSSSATLTLVLELSALDSLEVTDSTSLGQLVEMMAMDRVHVFSSTSNAQRAALQYAVNALTGAATKYEGFDFRGFASLGGETYAVRADGLYRIGAGTDDGELITALIDWGTSDFNDSHVKRAGTAFIGVRTDGQCYLRVRGDAGTERVYRARGDGDVRRSNLAQGVAARSWTISLEVVDASFAEVDSLELLVGVTQRRSFGRRTQ